VRRLTRRSWSMPCIARATAKHRIRWRADRLFNTRRCLRQQRVGSSYIWRIATSFVVKLVCPTDYQQTTLATDRRSRPRIAAASSRLADHALHRTAWAPAAADGDWRLVAQPVGSPMLPTGTWLSESSPAVRASEWATDGTGHTLVSLAAFAVRPTAPARQRYELSI